ncbi:MAG: nitrite reductase, copper-containing [Nitrospinae bacterium]|nr:nitrite reductase, copper-containing [Nitrospinota bacterium]
MFIKVEGGKTGLKRLQKLKNFLVSGSVLLALLAGIAGAEEMNTAEAPNVPPHTSRIMPETVVVKFEAKEFVGPLGDGKDYKFWSFNGTVPGPMIRVRLGDTVEFHLANDEANQFPHNIDLHAVNGPGGGAGVTLVAPGEKKVFQFKTLHPGLYIYHCASPVPSIPEHIANGMYGLILVEPKHGMSRVDHEFYVFQSEFFTQPSEDEGVLEFSLEKGMSEQPDYVVFNGKSGALMGDSALQAEVGDKIRIYFGNIGPNSASSFHIIGEIFDQVYLEGAVNGITNKNVQTTLVPSAGAAIVEFKVDVPGNYLLVDHSIFRVNKGAVGLLTVTGEEDQEIFKVLD